MINVTAMLGEDLVFSCQFHDFQKQIPFTPQAALEIVTEFIKGSGMNRLGEIKARAEQTTCVALVEKNIRKTFIETSEARISGAVIRSIMQEEKQPEPTGQNIDVQA